MRRTGTAGFTLLEVIFAIQFISIIAAVAIPNLIESRKSGNEASAIGALRLIDVAQQTHRAAHGSFATLEQLGQAGLIDAELARGEKGGYLFDDVPGATRLGWNVEARPARPWKTGDRSFFVDETGVIKANSCPPGYVPVWTRDGFVCKPSSESSGQQALENSDPLLLSIETAADLDLLSDQLALPQAKAADFSAPAVRALLSMIDIDRNGALAFDEVLNGDLFDATRRAARAAGDTGPPVGDDAELDHLLRQYQQAVRDALALGIANEGSPPPDDSIDCVNGYPRPFLELVPGASTRTRGR